MTTDDEQHAARLESWYASHPGTCLLCAQKRLLARGLAPWPHEGRTLLEVNCGPGLVEPHLRAMGLDVTGCEPSPALRRDILLTRLLFLLPCRAVRRIFLLRWQRQA